MRGLVSARDAQYKASSAVHEAASVRREVDFDCADWKALGVLALLRQH